MADNSNLILAGVTITGLVRTRNEDNFCLLSAPGRPLIFAAVADGIGGHRDGDLASLVCCREMLWAFSTAKFTAETPYVMEEFLRVQVAAANDRIFQRNQLNPSCRPMGTTLVCAVFAPDFLTFANVGDSRLYQYRNGELSQLSTDHSLCSNPEMMRKFQEVGLKCNPSNVICRAIGTHAQVEPQIATVRRSGGERYLLCSDGAYRDVDPAQFSCHIGAAPSPRELVNAVCRSALMAGGKDNITAVAAFPDPAQTEK